MYLISIKRINKFKKKNFLTGCFFIKKKMGGLCSRQKNRNVKDRNLRKKNLINTSHFGLCPDCNLPNTDKSQHDKYGWCRSCNSSRFEKGFASWTSDNPAIDDFIKESQKNATNNRQ